MFVTQKRFQQALRLDLKTVEAVIATGVSITTEAVKVLEALTIVNGGDVTFREEAAREADSRRNEEKRAIAEVPKIHEEVAANVAELQRQIEAIKASGELQEALALEDAKFAAGRAAFLETLF